MDIKIPPINIVAIAGQVASPPRTGVSDNGTPYTEFVLVNNKIFRVRDSSKREKSTFIAVMTWGKLALDCEKSLSTESPVYVVGEIETPLDAKRGRRGKPRIRASEVQFLERTVVGERQTSSKSRGQILSLDSEGNTIEAK